MKKFKDQTILCNNGNFVYMYTRIYIYLNVYNASIVFHVSPFKLLWQSFLDVGGIWMGARQCGRRTKRRGVFLFLPLLWTPFFSVLVLAAPSVFPIVLDIYTQDTKAKIGWSGIKNELENYKKRSCLNTCCSFFVIIFKNKNAGVAFYFWRTSLNLKKKKLTVKVCISIHVIFCKSWQYVKIREYPTDDNNYILLDLNLPFRESLFPKFSPEPAWNDCLFFFRKCFAHAKSINEESIQKFKENN